MAVADGRALALALKDFRAGVASIHVWSMLGWLEIKQRYRRSLLGPFWLTVSTGVMVGTMGPLYGRLFGQDVAGYILFVAVGFVCWAFIAGMITDACTAFIVAEGFIKQVKLPLTTYILRMVWKNLIIFLHNLVIVALALAIWPPASFSWHLLTIPLGVLAIVVNGVWVGICLGLLCARFRDIPQIINSVVQVAFFLTPVIWKSAMLGTKQWVAELNPFFHFIEIVRLPLISATANWFSWAVVAGITVAGYVVTFLMFARYRARIAYWV